MQLAGLRWELIDMRCMCIPPLVKPEHFLTTEFSIKPKKDIKFKKNRSSNDKF